MRVNITNAVKQFSPDPALEQVYFEAVANAIDAGASNIEIKINLTSFQASESLEIIITDDGAGFTDDRFEKFARLLENEDQLHKGLGRLVYLHYFKEVEVESQFNRTFRQFTFSDNFDGEKVDQVATNKVESSTALSFKGYRKSKIKSYDYVRARTIKDKLILHFFPQFHSRKIAGDQLRLAIEVLVEEPAWDYDFSSDKIEFEVSEMPDLEKAEIDARVLDLYQEFVLYYSVRANELKPEPITSIIADGRTIPIDILKGESLPGQYEAIFLLYSEYFNGKANPSRQKLDLPDHEMQTLRRLLTAKVGEILQTKLPEIAERNEQVRNGLSQRYPHLVGYFPNQLIALIDRKKAIEHAQKRFFADQRKILDAETLDDKSFEKSLEISSRTLTEYVLYRQKIIERLRALTIENKERDFHDLFARMQRAFQGENLMEDLYTNNVWLFDDKYMSYRVVLSDKRMSELLKHIVLDGESTGDDENRPDISLVFSGDPESEDAKVDVVVVEIKKQGLPLAQRQAVFTQLQQRARKLLRYFPNRINRVWFYGVIDFDDEIIVSLLDNGFSELFSKDKVFYQEQSVRPFADKRDFTVPASFYMISFAALIKDADARNATFLQILKQGMKKYDNSR